MINYCIWEIDNGVIKFCQGEHTLAHNEFSKVRIEILCTCAIVGAYDWTCAMYQYYIDFDSSGWDHGY